MVMSLKKSQSLSNYDLIFKSAQVNPVQSISFIFCFFDTKNVSNTGKDNK